MLQMDTALELFLHKFTCFHTLLGLLQSQPEELRGDELSDINLRLQNQLNQEKTDLQMKSEELNILIRWVCIGSLSAAEINGGGSD